MKSRVPSPIKPKSMLRGMWDLWVERANTRKALRLLSKQEWSIEFLTAMLVRAANLTHRPLEMTITNQHTTIRINTIDRPQTAYRDDSIFNHLDDEYKVQSFITEVNRR